MIHSADITIFADYATRAASGNFLKAPLFTGSNQNEGDIFVVGQELLTTGFAPPVITQLLSDAATQASICLSLSVPLVGLLPQRYSLVVLARQLLIGLDLESRRGDTSIKVSTTLGTCLSPSLYRLSSCLPGHLQSP